MDLRAVLFDLGGVVLDSPLHAIRRYEAELGFERNAINRVAATSGASGAWSRLERGELSLDAFYPAFESDCRDAGLEISARTMMERIGETSRPRASMLEAISRIRERGLRAAALTNNWATPETETATASGADLGRGLQDLRALFDAFIESSVEGLRKPDPRIYELACRRLSVEPPQVAFLDDIGRNLKTARALGMKTIKVDEPKEALAELEALLGFPLGADSRGN